jgi:hypothetical protein
LDEGATWSKRSPFVGADYYDKIRLSGDGRKIAVFGDGRLAVSTDGGETWMPRSQAVEDATWSKDGSVIFALYRSALRSTDNGETWQRVSGGGALQHSLESNADGSTFYSINCFNWAGPWTCFPYSSSLSTVSELQGEDEFKLIYLGNGVFSQMR